MKMSPYKGSGNKRPTPPDVVRVPFLDETDLRPGQEGFLTKDGLFLNGFFEPIKVQGETNFHFIKRPGLSLNMSTGVTAAGRGCYRWKQTTNLYSVVGSKIFSNTTDLGVTLTTTTGFVDITETRPGAATQYLGVNDGSALYLIAADNSVIVLNNVAITSTSAANPSTVIAANHGLNSGNKIIIRNSTFAGINDIILTITKVDANTFTVPHLGGGTGGTIGVFPAVNTGDLHYMDSYWFTMKPDGSIWNCASDDPTTWPTTSFIYAQMLPGRGIGLAKQDNTLIGFTDRHFQMFYDAANPVGSPLSNIEEAMHQLGCVSSNAIASQEDSVFWVANTQTGGFTVYQLDGTTNLQDIGTPTLNRSLSSNFFLTPGSPTSIKIVLTSGTSWTVPADFNVHNNTVEAIGGGHGGQGGTVAGNSGTGGGGAAYAKIFNFDNSGSPTIPYTIGAGGTAGTGGGGAGGAGGNTTFNTSTLVASGNGTGTPNTGTVIHTGGNGGASSPNPGGPTGASTGGGGGGAGGSIANGVNGDDGTNIFGGVSNGGQGNPGIGGTGGAGGAINFGGNGGNGNPGTELGTAGSGGGGGGGGSSRSIFNLPTGGGLGGNGGLYGAGGGGGGEDQASGAAGGSGSQGVIVITYVPTTAATDSTAANGYILRIGGHTFYVLNLINIKETWVYDQQFKVWGKWQSAASDIWPIVDAVQFALVGQPQVVVGLHPTNGNIYQISPSFGTDDGTQFEVRAQTLPLTFGNMKRKFYNQVELIGDTQLSSTPVIITYSDDDYTTFSSGVTFDMVGVRFFKRAWGNSRRRAWRVSYTGTNPLRIYGLEFTVEMDDS